jgi:hypothetical protein
MKTYDDQNSPYKRFMCSVLSKIGVSNLLLKILKFSDVFA